jgi:hypothetical protein
MAMPYVSAATFCEAVIAEESRGMYSLIRLLDTITVSIATASQADATRPVGVTAGVPVVQVWLFVGMKSGDVKGKRTIRLRLRSPSNQLKPLADPIPVVFEGGEHGAVLRVQVTLAVEEYGLYWAEVLCNDELLVKVPLRVRRDERSARPAESSPPERHQE